MNKQEYLDRGFKTILKFYKDLSIGRRKHGCYTTFYEDVKAKSGVYLIVKGDEVVKIGETVDVERRFKRLYAYNPEQTHSLIREYLNDGEFYEVLFYETVPEIVEVVGVQTKKGISYRDLEKALINEYVDKVGKLPALNKTYR